MCLIVSSLGGEEEKILEVLFVEVLAGRFDRPDYKLRTHRVGRHTSCGGIYQLRASLWRPPSFFLPYFRLSFQVIQNLSPEDNLAYFIVFEQYEMVCQDCSSSFCCGLLYDHEVSGVQNVVRDHLFLCVIVKLRRETS